MKTRYLTPDEVRRLAAASSAEEWLPLRVAVETGLRIGDVLKIRAGDFVRGGVRYRAQKTGKQGRAALSDELVLALYRSSRGTRWCFPSPRDSRRHLTRQACWARMKQAARRTRCARSLPLSSCVGQILAKCNELCNTIGSTLRSSTLLQIGRRGATRIFL